MSSYSKNVVAGDYLESS